MTTESVTSGVIAVASTCSRRHRVRRTSQPFEPSAQGAGLAENDLVTSDPARRLRLRAPELSGRAWLNTGGQDLSLAGLRGKVLLLDFWAS